MSPNSVNPVPSIFDTVEINGSQYAKFKIATLGYQKREKEIFEQAFIAETPNADLKTEDGLKQYQAWSDALTGLQAYELRAQVIYVPLDGAPSITTQFDYLPIAEITETANFLLMTVAPKSYVQDGSKSTTVPLDQTAQGLNTTSTSQETGEMK